MSRNNKCIYLIDSFIIFYHLFHITIGKDMDNNINEIKSMDKKNNTIYPRLLYDEHDETINLLQTEVNVKDINAYLKLDNGDNVPQVPLHSSDLKRNMEYLDEFDKLLITRKTRRDDYIIDLKKEIESLDKVINQRTRIQHKHHKMF